MKSTRHSVSCPEPEDDGEPHFAEIETARAAADSRAQRDRELMERLAKS